MVLNDKKQKPTFLDYGVYLANKGLAEGEAQPFPKEVYERLSHYIFYGLPVSIEIKYLMPLVGPGKCYERSWLLTMAFDECYLVRGDLKDYGISYGKEHAGHGWVEADGWIYDPTSLYRYKKDLFYKIHKPRRVVKIAKPKFQNDEEYKKCASPKIEKQSLLIKILITYAIAELREDKDFINEIAEYLRNLGYDSIDQLQQDAEETFWKTIGKGSDSPKAYAYYQKK